MNGLQPVPATDTVTSEEEALSVKGYSWKWWVAKSFGSPQLLVRAWWRAVGTNLAYEGALLHQLSDTVGKRFPRVAGWMNRTLQLDNPRVGKVSHLGFPRGIPATALMMPLALALSPVSLVLGVTASALFAAGIVSPSGGIGTGQRPSEQQIETDLGFTPAGVTQATLQEASSGVLQIGQKLQGAQSYPRNIEHVIVLIQENHSFDNYFGRFPGANGAADLPEASNPPQYTFPWLPTHGHWTWKFRQWMAVREQYTEKQLPLYYDYARRYTLCDNFFTDVAGPSDPNHLMAFAASSGELINNPRPAWIRWLTRDHSKQPPFTIPSLPESLSSAGVSWKNYGDGTTRLISPIAKAPENVSSREFAKDVAAKSLPQVSWLVSPSMDENDHPPANVYAGQQWVGEQIDLLVKNGYWDKSLIVLVWDDFGGFYDHVTPPLLERWTDGTTHYRLGDRVPCILMGGQVKEGHVDHTQYSFCSIVKSIEDIKGLKPLNERDASANGFAGALDGSKPSAAPPRPHRELLAPAMVGQKNFQPRWVQMVSDRVRTRPSGTPQLELRGRSVGSHVSEGRTLD